MALEMHSAMRAYLEINKKIKDLEQQKEELKSLMSVHLVETNVDTFEDADGNTASYRKMKRKTLDKMKVQNICVIKQIDYEDLLTESEVQVFKITTQEQKDSYTKRKVKQ